jgi:hypothetical protein
MPPLLRGIPPPIGTPLIKGDPPAYRHPPYQGGQGGSNLKSIFNLIITSYLYFTWLLFNSYIKKQQVRLLALLGLVGKMYSKIHFS